MIIPGLPKKVRAYLKNNPGLHKPGEVAGRFGITGTGLTRLARRDPSLRLVTGAEGHHTTALLIAHADSSVPRLVNNPGYKILMSLGNPVNMTALRENAGVGNAVCRAWVLRLEDAGLLERAGGMGRRPAFGLSKYGKHVMSEQARRGRSTVSMLEALAPNTTGTSLRADLDTAGKLVEQFELVKDYEAAVKAGNLDPPEITQLAKKYKTSPRDVKARAAFGHSPIGGASEQRAMFIFTLIRKYHGPKVANGIWERMDAAGRLSFGRSDNLTGQNYERRTADLEREMATDTYEQTIFSVMPGIRAPFAAVNEIKGTIKTLKSSQKRNGLERSVVKHQLAALEGLLKRAEETRSKALAKRNKER